MEDSCHVLEHWDYKGYFAENYVKQLLKRLPSIGIYHKKEERGSPLLVAWCLTKTTGEIGLTYTLPKYRNRGFGSIVTLKLAEILLQHYFCIPFVVILNSNTVSIALHKKLGFVEDCCTDYGKFVI